MLDIFHFKSNYLVKKIREPFHVFNNELYTVNLKISGYHNIAANGEGLGEEAAFIDISLHFSTSVKCNFIVQI